MEPKGYHAYESSQFLQRKRQRVVGPSNRLREDSATGAHFRKRADPGRIDEYRLRLHLRPDILPAR